MDTAREEQERRERHLEDAIASANQALGLADQTADRAFFYASAWPVDPEGIIQTWTTTENNLVNAMHPLLDAALTVISPSVQPNLDPRYPNLVRRGVAWRIGSNFSGTPLSRLVDLEVRYDGRCCLTMGGATDLSQGNGMWTVNADAISTLAVRAFVAFGALYERADFEGQVDVGVAVTRVAQKKLLSGASYVMPGEEGESITLQHDYKQTRTIDVADLKKNPIAYARYLLWPFLQATSLNGQDRLSELRIATTP